MTIIKQRPHPAHFTPFGGVFSPFFNSIDQLHGSDDLPRSSPRVNIVESKNGFQLELQAPGFAKEDLKLNVENDTLTISAEKKSEELDENERYTRREFSLGSFKRSFHLPEHADIDAISAGHVNGVLTVNIPKKAESKPAAKEIHIG